MRNKTPMYDDFFSWMPSKLKKAVFQTEICNRFLFERKNIGERIYQHVKSGGSINDECLHGDVERLQSLTAALGEEIVKIKRRLYPEPRP